MIRLYRMEKLKCSKTNTGRKYSPKENKANEQKKISERLKEIRVEVKTKGGVLLPGNSNLTKRLKDFVA